MKKNHSIAGEMIRFSLPLIMSGILQQLYSWADAFIVGHSGETGELMLAAVGATGSITTLLVQTIVGFTLGLSIMAAQEYGKKNMEKLHRITGSFGPVLAAVYTVLAFIAIACVRPILRQMSTPAEIFDYSAQYLRIVLLGVPFLAVYNLLAALLRAVGNSKASFYAVLLSSLMNVALDVLLVLVFPFGVAGAAAATVISQIAMTVFMAAYLRKRYPELVSQGMCFDRSVFRQGLSFSMPPTLQNSVTSAGNLVLQNFMNQFGAVTVLAITTSYRVDSLMLLPLFNLGSAISSMTARSKGEGNAEKVRACLKTGLWLMFAVCGVLTVMMFLFGSSFVAFFGVTGEALETGRQFFRDLSLFYVPFGLATAMRSALEGIGDISYCSAVGIGTLIIRIVFSYIFRPLMGNRAIAFAEAVAWMCLLVLMVVRLWQKKKQKQI